MEVNEVDKAAFQAKMDGVWADYASQAGRWRRS